MHIIIATGIYPPDLGGPATYSYALAQQLTKLGHTVEIITYGTKLIEQDWPVYYVAKQGVFFVRWWRYARLLRRVAHDADIVYSLGTISEGIPLLLSRVRKPKRVLRLGGDFLWERYINFGGKKSLREFYHNPPGVWRWLQWLTLYCITQYHHIIFSTEWQKKIYSDFYTTFSHTSVVPNAIQVSGKPTVHLLHKPVKLLSMGRLVRVKQIHLLIAAVLDLPNTTLSIVGDGPEKSKLKQLVHTLNVQDRVRFIESVRATMQQNIFAESDLLIIPSLSDTSPNTALEAVAHGLPVLITEQTGLASTVLESMTVCDLSSVKKIATAIEDCVHNYDSLLQKTHLQKIERTWHTVASEHVELFKALQA